MQAVADKLGVDRKALHYHVRDVRSLRALVAREVYGSELAKLELHPGADWRDLMRSFASGMRVAFLSTGVLTSHVTFPLGGEPAALVSADTVLQALLGAGFGPSEARRALLGLSQLAIAAARDEMLAGDERVHPQSRELARVLAGLPEDKLVALRAVVAHDVPVVSELDFGFDVDVFIAGLAQLLANRLPPAAPERG